MNGAIAAPISFFSMKPPPLRTSSSSCGLTDAFMPRRMRRSSAEGTASAESDDASAESDDSSREAAPVVAARRSRRSAVHWDRPSAAEEPLVPIEGPFELAAELVEAVESSDVPTVRGLLAASPFAVRGWKQCSTLLHSAALEGCEPMVSLLIEAGASLAALDEEGQTPLHVACANEQVGVAALLAARVPCWELLVEDKYRMTPLHLATESGDEELVSILLQSLQQLRTAPGADANAILRLRRGTCEFLAQRHGFSGVQALLLCDDHCHDSDGDGSDHSGDTGSAGSSEHSSEGEKGGHC